MPVSEPPVQLCLRAGCREPSSAWYYLMHLGKESFYELMEDGQIEQEKAVATSREADETSCKARISKKMYSNLLGKASVSRLP